MSAAETAAQLGTSIPRVVRAILSLAPDARQSNGRYALTEAHVERLRRHLGVTVRVAGLTPTEAKALAALSRAPLGLRSRRAVAERAGVSATAASRALGSLQSRELVFTRTLLIASGRVRRVTMWHANRLHPSWTQIAVQLAGVLPPQPVRSRSECVPPRLMHLFWNTAASQLSLAHGGPYIARRLLRTMDPEGLAWGSANLTADDWRQGARARGLEPSVKALAENLAVANARVSRTAGAR
jgi:hypothetical protein